MPPARDPSPDPPSRAMPVDGDFQAVLIADPPSVRQGLIRLAGSPPMVALTADHRATAELVLAEVLNNVAEHAYAGQPGSINVSVRLDGRALVCHVTDLGKPMPGGTLPSGRLPETDLPEGGFGWHLIRSLTQNLDYARIGGQNRLSFLIPRQD